MRIGMICPYSLTVPGGVQIQVLGLAQYEVYLIRSAGFEIDMEL